MNQSSVKKERHYGIDLLRLVCMYMIPVLHVLGQGGVMARTKSNDPTYFACWLLEILCLCAVNCYALISGYVGLEAKFRPGRLLRMAGVVEFYSVLILVVFRFLHPELVTRDVVLKALLPVQWKAYWYYSDYVGLFFLMPFLNKGVLAMDRRERDRTMLVLFLLLSVFTTVSKTFSQDPFQLIGGYSLIWLCALYVFGACLRGSRLLELPRYVCLAGYFGCAAFAWIWKCLFDKKILPLPEETSMNRMFVTYTSPTIFLCGLCLFLFFVNTKIRASAARKGIAVLSPLAFYVYIIHVNPVIWDNYFYQAFKTWRELPPVRCIPLVLLAALGIYLVCLAIEFVRSRAVLGLRAIIRKPEESI